MKTLTKDELMNIKSCFVSEKSSSTCKSCKPKPKRKTPKKKSYKKRSPKKKSYKKRSPKKYYKK